MEFFTTEALSSWKLICVTRAYLPVFVKIDALDHLLNDGVAQLSLVLREVLFDLHAVDEPVAVLVSRAYRVDSAELVEQQLLVLEEKLRRKETLELEPVDLSVAICVKCLEYAVSLEASEASDVRERVK